MTIKETDFKRQNVISNDIYTDFGISGLKAILPLNDPSNKVYAIEGPRDTFKSTIGLCYLMQGLLNGEHVLSLRLRQKCRQYKTVRLSTDLDRYYWNSNSISQNDKKKVDEYLENQINRYKNATEEQKRYLYLRDSRNVLISDIIKVRNGIAKDYPKLLDEFINNQINKYENIELPKDKDKRYKKKLDLFINECTIDRIQIEPTPENPIQTEKYEKRTWEYGNGKLIEYAFKSGMILSEEFIDIILEEMQLNPHITRVVLDDVGLIGLNYPYLRRSNTSVDLFLATFVNVMRNYNVGLILCGTPGQLPASQEMVQTACSLANSVISCQFCDVYGDRYVIVTGQGLVSATSRSAGERSELVPGVVRVNEIIDSNGDVNRKISPVYIDTECLQGLVGFDTGNIHRSGLVVYLYTEKYITDALKSANTHSKDNTTPQIIQSNTAKYNKSIENVLDFAYRGLKPNGNQRDNDTSEGGVLVREFDAQESPALHKSLTVFGGHPISQTVVSALDEFWLAIDKPENLLINQIIGNNHTPHPSTNSLVSLKSGKTLLAKPYYGNVLLLACDLEFIKDFNTKHKTDIEKDMHIPSWNQLLEIFDNNKYSFKYDNNAEETITCAMMDALINDAIVNSAFNYKKIEINKTKYENPWSEDKIRGEILGTLLKDKNNNFSNTRYKNSNVLALAKLLRSDYDLNNNDSKPGVYLYWYSQLRDILIDNPNLGRNVKAFALPGYGFRGDWFLGIVDGSVSVNLGLKIIDTLCNRNEQYQRFSKGVGLPIDIDFYYKAEKCGFTAWTYADQSVIDVLDIHHNASTRAHIPGYPSFRNIIKRACDKLISVDKNQFNEEYINETIRHMAARISLILEDI